MKLEVLAAEEGDEEKNHWRNAARLLGLVRLHAHHVAPVSKQTVLAHAGRQLL